MIDKLNYENVLHVLTNNLNTSETESERQIAKLLLENFSLIPEVSIETLANKCFISQPTLTRYIKRLGYQNYSEFKRYVIAFVKVLADEVNYNLFEENETEAIDTSFNETIQSINKTKELLNYQLLSTATEQIYQAKNIVIIGIDYSEIVALDAQLRFMRYNKLMNTAIKTNIQRELIADLKQGDLLIVMSVSGFTKGLVDVCEHLDPAVNSIVISSMGEPKILNGHTKRTVLNITSDLNLNVNSSLNGRINLLMIIDSLYLLYGIKYYSKV